MNNKDLSCCVRRGRQGPRGHLSHQFLSCDVLPVCFFVFKQLMYSRRKQDEDLSCSMIVFYYIYIYFEFQTQNTHFLFLPCQQLQTQLIPLFFPFLYLFVDVTLEKLQQEEKKSTSRHAVASSLALSPETGPHFIIFLLCVCCRRSLLCHEPRLCSGNN